MTAISQNGIYSRGSILQPAIQTLFNIVPAVSDWWYQSYAQAKTTTTGAVPYNQLNPFSELRLSTDATILNVGCGSALNTTNNTISVFVNGSSVPTQVISFATGEQNMLVTKVVTLPPGQKTVKFMLGYNNLAISNALPIQGQFINSISATSGNLSIINPVRNSNVVVYFGNSLISGQGASSPELTSMIALLKNDPRMANFDIVTYSSGGHSVGLWLGTSPSFNQVLSDLTSLYARYSGIKIFRQELSTNDYGFVRSTPTTYQTYLNQLVTALKTTFPSLIRTYQTALYRNTETAVGGFTLTDFRNAVTSVSTGDAGSNLILGTDILRGTGFVAPDGIHIVDAAYAIWADYEARKILGIPVIPAPSRYLYYLTTANSSTGQVTIPSAGINIGSKTNWSITFKAIRLRTGAIDEIFSQGATNTNNIDISIGSTGLLTVYSQTNGNVAAIYQLRDQLWHNYAITYNNAVITFYMDGYQFFSQTLSTPISYTPTATTRIGAKYLNNSFSNVGLNNFRMYNYTLTDAQVKTDATTDVLSSYTNMIAAYDFQNNVNDLTGNGNTGTAGAAVTYSNTP